MLLHIGSFLVENGPNMAMQVAADQQLEQSANVGGKEVVDKEKDSLIANGTSENGNVKESPNRHEESDILPER